MKKLVRKFEGLRGALGVSAGRSLQAVGGAGVIAGVIESSAQALAAGAETTDLATQMTQAANEGAQIIQQETQLEEQMDQAFAEIAKAEDAGANPEQIAAARQAYAQAYSAWRAFGASLGN